VNGFIEATAGRSRWNQPEGAAMVPEPPRSSNAPIDSDPDEPSDGAPEESPAIDAERLADPIDAVSDGDPA
jgi:hypothetical protein